MFAPVACVGKVSLAPVHIRVVVRSHERLLRRHRIIAREEVLCGPILAQRQERGRVVPAIAVWVSVGKTPTVSRTVGFDESPRSLGVLAQMPPQAANRVRELAGVRESQGQC
jgi:hypothetical protein